MHIVMVMLRRDIVLLSYFIPLYSITMLFSCFITRREGAPVYLSVVVAGALCLHHVFGVISGVIMARTVDKDLQEEAPARLVENELKVPLVCAGGGAGECV